MSPYALLALGILALAAYGAAVAASRRRGPASSSPERD